MDVESAVRSVCDGGHRMLAAGLVSGTWGNISCRIDDHRMAISPSGMNYETLRPEDIPIVDFSGKKMTWTGAHAPSMESQLHIAIYKERSDIGAVIHTHSMNASTVAVARREIPPILDDMVQIIGPTVRVADYALPSTGRLVRNVMSALRGRNAALLANHGAVCLGRDMNEAFTCAAILEKTCKAFIEAEFLGGAKTISRVDAFIMREYYLRKYSKTPK